VRVSYQASSGWESRGSGDIRPGESWIRQRQDTVVEHQIQAECIGHRDPGPDGVQMGSNK